MSNVKSEKVIIVGKTGSGKDYLMRKLIEKGLTPCVRKTTRPIRANEKQGVNYNYVDRSEFDRSIINNEFIIYESYNVISENGEPDTWYYGIEDSEFDKSQICIMTPKEVIKIYDSKLSKNCIIIYLDINREIREKRVFNRRDKNDSIKRRMESDEIDFKGFDLYDLKICDPDFNTDDIYDLIN